MGKLITEEVERLQEKADEEIMTIYGSHIINGFPSMIVLKSLGIIMTRRNLKPREIITYLKYQDFNNKKLVHIQVTPL
jgi:hypothetical protein